jgi:nucleotide-binding universal stress UspA family protein
MQPSTPTHILVPTDGSERAQRAAEHAAHLARCLEARITFLSVVEAAHSVGGDDGLYPRLPDDFRTLARAFLEVESRRALEAAAAVAGREGIAFSTARSEGAQPHRAIVDAAQSLACDLIVVASGDRLGVEAFLLGGDTAAVLGHSGIPVLVCR